MASSRTAPEIVEGFLFAPTDARGVGLLRVLFAGMLAFAFWPRTGYEVRGWAVGLEPLYDAVFLTPMYGAAILGMIAVFALGIRSRPVALLLFVMLLPMASLNVGQQSRQVLLLALLAFALLRSDAARSLRAWRSGALVSAGPAWPIRLMQLQLSLVYGVNALAKTTPGYLNGEILMGMAQMRPNIHVDLSDGFLHLGPFAIPVALAAVMSVLTEYFLAIAFWFPRLRYLAAAVGFMFHGLLMWMMTIFMLDWATIFLYLAFLLPLIRPRDDPSPQAVRAPMGDLERLGPVGTPIYELHP